jgi:hypothetical protein
MPTCPRRSYSFLGAIHPFNQAIFVDSETAWCNETAIAMHTHGRGFKKNNAYTLMLLNLPSKISSFVATLKHGL